MRNDFPKKQSPVRRENERNWLSFSEIKPFQLRYAYFEDGTAAVAATKDGSSIYAAVPFIPSQLLRDLVREKGIFVYSTNPYIYTYVNADAICVYNASAADAVLFVPADGVYVDQITNETFTAECGMLRLPLRGLRAYLLMRNTGK